MRLLRRALHLAQRFAEVARAGGLRVALSIARRKVSRAIASRWRMRVRASASAGIPADLADVRSRGCRLSVVVPVYDTPPALLRECVQSVLSQVYPHWELCLCDDGSTREDTRAAIEELRGSDPRFRIVTSDANLHIAGATNLAAEQATGKFLVFLDHDDVLHPWALYEVAKADLRWNDIDVLYTDEDKLDAHGYRRDPYYKPDWSPEHLDSVMYLLHMLVVRKRLFWRLGGMRAQFAGAQDYDLALRATRQARRVHHVDRIRYHWRMIPGSAAGAVDAKPYAVARARRALEESARERGIDATVEDGQFPGSFRLRRRVDRSVPVTLLVLTNYGKRAIEGRGEVDLLRNFVGSIRARSTHPSYQLVVVDNGNAGEAERAFLADAGARLESFAPEARFNYPRKLNFALRFVDTEMVLLLNDDLEVITPDWIESLLEYACDPAVGVAGARLRYPDGRIQHAGLALGLNGTVGHVCHGMPLGQVGYNGYSHLVRNYSAVTGAVMATRMSVLRELGGFDEAFAVDFNDVDFCLRARQLGKRIVYTPYSELVHFEGSSLVRRAQDPVEAARFAARWHEWIERDPYFNVNLPRDDPSLASAAPGARE